MKNTRARITLAALAGVVVGVAGSLAASSVASTAATRAGAAQPARATPHALAEDQSESLHDDQARALSYHAHEPLDSDWSRATTPLFQQDLAEVARAGGFTVDHVDCRTSSCTAEVHFASYPEALAQLRPIMHHSYRVDCTRELAMRPPADPQQPYSSMVFFGCRPARETVP